MNLNIMENTSAMFISKIEKNLEKQSDWGNGNANFNTIVLKT
jgi:hypothetical protein